MDAIYDDATVIAHETYSPDSFTVQEKYGNEFNNSIHSCIQQDIMLRHSLGLESRDDSPQCSPKSQPKHAMTFQYGDITKGIDQPSESFDLIICKKTLDVILCSAGSTYAARAMMKECFRLLNNDHGVMIIVSSGKPEDRAVFFEQDPWTGVLNVKLPAHPDDARKSHHKKVLEHFVYVLYKQNAK
jgi:hypothetical protein